jgi:opacity protein-like surface antigen
MIQMGKPSLGVLAAALFATAVVGSAIADMVYDDEASQRSGSASSTSQEMSAAPTNSVEVRNMITTETVSAAPVIAEAPKVQKTSEKSREKRGFHESMNNELVVQKLEDRRLKQEEKLTAEINKRFTLEDEAGTAAPVMNQEQVIKPINESSASYEMSAAPKGGMNESRPIAQQDQVAVYQSSTVMSQAPVAAGSSDASMKVEDSSHSFGRRISVVPRGGTSWISNSNYDFNSQFSVGGALSFDASEHLAVELGYTYSQYGVRIGQSAMGYSSMFPAQELRFKNNSFDATMKIYLTGRQAFVRPFVGGGFGYSVGYVNYDNATQQYLHPAYRQDYELSQFQGILQGGLDFKVSDNVFVGALYKYVTPLSSSESQGGLNPGAFYPYAGYGAMDPQKQALRGTFRDSSIGYFLVSAGFQF